MGFHLWFADERGRRCAVGPAVAGRSSRHRDPVPSLELAGGPIDNPGGPSSANAMATLSSEHLPRADNGCGGVVESTDGE